LAEEHHQQLLQQQQQQQQQQQEQSLRLQQMSLHGGSDGCPPAVEARLLLLEQVL
jgi:transcription initiation factor TFIID subunit TAF12